MPIALRCPTCSAPLDVPREHASTVRCPYCGAGAMLRERAGEVSAAAADDRQTADMAAVVEHLRRGHRIAAIKEYRERFGGGLKEAKEAVERLESGGGAGPSVQRDARPAGGRSRAPLVLAAGGVLAAGIVGVVAMRAGSAPTAAVAPAAPPAAAPALPVQPARTGIGEELLRFGSEGTGAGRFRDARGVAVDAAGRIYVGEYSGGRVQVFDSAGTFVTQWTADAGMPMRDLAADRAGTVYVVQSGRIRRFDGATGRALGDLTPDGGYGDVAVALDGSLWAVAQGDRVIHLSPDGEVLRRIDLKQAVDEDASAARVAVAGTGDLYVLDQWKAHVYHLDAGGRFVDRFGDGGFPPAEDVVVDGRGRVIVSGFGGIRVFDGAGQPLGDISGTSAVFGLAANDRDELLAAARNANAIIKFRIAPD